MTQRHTRITPVGYTILVRIFEMDGWTTNRIRGDHIIMTKSGAKRPLVIKTSPRQVAVSHIRSNLTTAGIGRDRYFELLEQAR